MALLVGFGAVVPALAEDAPPASATLVNYLVGVLEKREQPPQAPRLGVPFTMPPAFDNNDAERQLRSLGGRAASGAPRVAALYATTERNLYELAWTLWSIAPPPAPGDLQALTKAYAGATGADRYVLLARVGQLRAASSLTTLTASAHASDVHERLLAAVALGFCQGNDDSVALLLAGLLKDDVKAVRLAGVNGLRLLGPRGTRATPALLDYLRTRDNVYAATTALANASAQDLRPAQADLEAIINDPKLTDYQKQPVVALLIRIEQAASAKSAP